MIKALLAWELGGGQGHLHRLAAIADFLTEQGIEPILALRHSHPKGIELPLSTPLINFSLTDE